MLFLLPSPIDNRIGPNKPLSHKSSAKIHKRASFDFQLFLWRRRKNMLFYSNEIKWIHFFFSCCDMLIRLPNKIENKEFHSIRSNRVESWDEQKSHSLSNIKSHFTVLLRKHYHTKTSKHFVCIQNTLFKSDITKYKSFKYQLNAMMMAWPASGCSSCVTTSNEKEIFNAIHELRQQL